jgi:hypothetical protein
MRHGFRAAVSRLLSAYFPSRGAHSCTSRGQAGCPSRGHRLGTIAGCSAFSRVKRGFGFGLQRDAKNPLSTRRCIPSKYSGPATHRETLAIPRHSSLTLSAFVTCTHAYSYNNCVQGKDRAPITARPLGSECLETPEILTACPSGALAGAVTILKLCECDETPFVRAFPIKAA